MNAAASGPVVLSLGSRFDNIELAQFVMSHVLKEHHVNGQLAHGISMALREALANAIKHGNRQDPSKRVTLTIEWEGDQLRVIVEDEGEGFDENAIEDPLAPENRLKTAGRGIFLIRNFMDDVRFESGDRGGTILILTKKLVIPANKEEQER
jgi:anti-sigma regulatory factor (Ser/Thr protein kinase)